MNSCYKHLTLLLSTPTPKLSWTRYGHFRWILCDVLIHVLFQANQQDFERGSSRFQQYYQRRQCYRRADRQLRRRRFPWRRTRTRGTRTHQVQPWPSIFEQCLGSAAQCVVQNCSRLLDPAHQRNELVHSLYWGFMRELIDPTEPYICCSRCELCCLSLGVHRP